MKPSHLALLLCIAVLGVTARMILGAVGFGPDIVSYWLVTDIAERGGNVYAETWRYNYAPGWLHILGWLKDAPPLAADPFVSFRLKVSAFLTLVDTGLVCLLLGRYGMMAACLVLLNPISIGITGYQGQSTTWPSCWGWPGCFASNTPALTPSETNPLPSIEILRGWRHDACTMLMPRDSTSIPPPPAWAQRTP